MPRSRLGGPALRDYQSDAVAVAVRTLTASGGKVTVALPCGTGKTLIGQHIAARIRARRVLFAPTVHLVEQNLRAWLAARPDLATIAVHRARPGDLGTASAADDEDIADPVPSAAGVVSTDPETVTAAITAARQDLLVACTYQSASTLTELGASGGFDLVILDEAHRTVGELGRPWQAALDRDAIPARRQLSLTATPKTVTIPEPADPTGEQPPVTVIDMADSDTYGPVIAPLTVRQAIPAGHLADYRIVIVAVTQGRHRGRSGSAARNRAAHRRAAGPAGSPVGTRPDGAAGRNAPPQGAHRAGVHQHRRGVPHLDRHPGSTVGAAPPGRPADRRRNRPARRRHHPAAGRHQALAAVADNKHWAVISNCRLLGEGVDAPALDIVIYAEARTSTVDIVQCTGRALRRNPKNSSKKATIVLPVTIPEQHTDRADRRVAASAFRHVAQVLAALATTDDALADVLFQMRGGPPDQPPPTDPTGFLQIIGIDDPHVAGWFARAFRSHVIDRITRIEAELRPAAVLYARRHGHTRIPVGYTDRWGRLIGRQIADLRSRHRDGLLDPGVAELFEQIEHRTWTLPGTTQDARRREIIRPISEIVHTSADLPITRYAHRQLSDGSTLRLGQ